ncbi:hypothetical protein TNCV_2369071 [Trichonephila clavipes]|nr:hypothetical protein TNCV_2369071 [Trichonephila clavipes]
MSSQARSSPGSHSLSKSSILLKGLHIDLVLKAPDSQECVLEMPGSHSCIITHLMPVREMLNSTTAVRPLKSCSLPQRGEGVFLEGIGEERREKFSPGRVTLGVKAIPLCPAKNCRDYDVGIDSNRAPSVPNASTLSITPRRSSSRDV